MQLVSDIQQNHHNQKTATYHLFREKKERKRPNCQWVFEEQRDAALKIGFELVENGEFKVVEKLFENDSKEELEITVQNSKSTVE